VLSARFSITITTQQIERGQLMDDPILCVYCGLLPATTMDHVIPKAFFVPPLPSNLVTVPVCKPCNNKKSKNDSYLRDLLVMDLDCCDHPVAKELMKGKVIRSAIRNRSEIARSARKARPKAKYSINGLYLGHFPSFPIDGTRLNESFATIVRGLYYRLRGIRLRDDYSFKIGRVDSLHLKDAYDLMVKMRGNGPYVLANVFGCVFLYVDEDPHLTNWLLWFYGGFVLQIYTFPKGDPDFT
jgi:hypothetical protein